LHSLPKCGAIFSGQEWINARKQMMNGYPKQRLQCQLPYVRIYSRFC
jgi:hypothetical protein